MHSEKYAYIISLFFWFSLYGNQQGYKELLNRKYNEVTFPVTHNGQSYKGASGYTGWLVSVQNQDKSITQQLKSGIRGIKIPLHYEYTKKGKVLTACHGLEANYLKSKAPRFTPKFILRGLERHPHYYDKAARPFKDLIKEVKEFLDTHRQEMFTFFLEDTTNNHETVEQAFINAGMYPEIYMHIQDKKKPWPTLKQMIKSGKRVVVFISSTNLDGKIRPWLLAMDDFVWQTHYNFGDAHDLKNDTLDPKIREGASLHNFNSRFLPPKNKISVVQHFITPSTKKYTLYLGGKLSEAKKVNKHAFLMPRLEAIYKKAQIPLNFIWVDFFEHGDLFEIVDQLNGIGKFTDKKSLFALK